MIRLFAAVALCCLGGCAAEQAATATGQVPPGIARITLTAAAGLNPAQGGVANPAQVRIYHLRDVTKFNNADYFQLADKEQRVLGEDLIDRDEYSVRPGETRTIDAAIRPGEKFIGVAVAYRNIDRATWRVATPVQGRVTLMLGANRVTLAPGT